MAMPAKIRQRSACWNRVLLLTRPDTCRPVIAHELNNILAIVQGYADRLILKCASDVPLHSQLKMITEAARRAAIIVRDATPPPSLQPGSRLPKKPEPSLA